MEKILKVLGIIFKSYCIGAVLFLISAVILAILGVEINPSHNTLKWDLCILFVGFLGYWLKQD
jgi:hypothetical protein